MAKRKKHDREKIWMVERSILSLSVAHETVTKENCPHLVDTDRWFLVDADEGVLWHERQKEPEEPFETKDAVFKVFYGSG
jgi:hypothetical protein